MKGYLIVGTGGHGRTVLSYLERADGPRSQIAFVDMFEKRADTIVGCPIVGDLTKRIQHPFDSVKVIVAYGCSPTKGNKERQSASMTVARLLGDDFRFTTVIDPSAVITPDATVASNVSIGSLAIVGTGSSVSEGVILNNSVIVDHDARVGAFSQLSPGALVMGDTTIGERVFLGAGAVIRDDISVGADSVVGMGAIVTEDIPSNALVMGNPAKVVKRL